MYKIQCHCSVQKRCKANQCESHGMAPNVSGTLFCFVQLFSFVSLSAALHIRIMQNERLTKGAMTPLELPMVNCNPVAVVLLP